SYVAASRLSLPLLEGKSQQPFYCQATHPKGGAITEVSNPGRAPVLPVVTLHPPSRDAFDGPYRNSSLLCQIRGPARTAGTVRWLRNGAPFDDGVTTESFSDSHNGLRLTNSRVSVTEAEWDAGTVYSCQVGDELRNTSKALECG
ncbi:IGHM protein, partial [Steatornis caripensis]|nr:IGHM protein [Steatornis caripensis]